MSAKTIIASTKTAPLNIYILYIYMCVVFGPEKLVYILYSCTQYEC